MYEFKEQLSKGEEAEAKLEKYFSQWFDIRKVGRAQQRQGIDRLFRPRNGGDTVKVEIKTDWTASRTGNAFVETISVDTANKRGWAYTSQADVLLYYLPDDGLLYWITFARLRNQLAGWGRYPVRKIPNKGYYTHGLLVPLREFEAHSERIICI